MQASVHGLGLVLVGMGMGTAGVNVTLSHVVVSDQLNLTGFSLPKPHTTPEDYGESEEDYY